MFSAARWQLTVVFTAVLVVILVASGVVVYLTTRSVILDRVDDDLKERAQNDLFLLSLARGRPRGEPSQSEPEFDPGGYFFALVDQTGQVVDSSAHLDPEALAPQATLDEALEGGEAFTDAESSDGEPQRIYVQSVRTLDGSDWLLQLGRSTAPEHDALSQLRNILIAVVGISAAPALFGGYLLSGRALRRIAAAMESQRTFIADASHELRTPVSVVRTNAEILQRHLQSETIGRSASDAVALDDILSESDRLGRMVGQMLTLAEADAGKTALTPSGIALNELAEEVARSMRALAEAKGVALQTRTDGNVWVRGDRERLREVLVTLLDNAIKYTDAGGRVDVTVARMHRRAALTVSDTGVGISADSLPHIFERFYRVDKARSRESGGTGLGLSIARHVIEAHGGTIRIESEVGKGTRVTIELRLETREPQPDVARLSGEVEP